MLRRFRISLFRPSQWYQWLWGGSAVIHRVRRESLPEERICRVGEGLRRAERGLLRVRGHWGKIWWFVQRSSKDQLFLANIYQEKNQEWIKRPRRILKPEKDSVRKSRKFSWTTGVLCQFRRNKSLRNPKHKFNFPRCGSENLDYKLQIVFQNFVNESGVTKFTTVFF